MLPWEIEIDELLAADAPSAEELVWSAFGFRRRLLDACGFAADDALALALDPRIGLDRPLALTRRGCPPAVAARILL